MNIIRLIHQWEKKLHTKYENLPNTLEGSRQANFYMKWLDHELLRICWRNIYELAPGVWRGNHPTAKGWMQLKTLGIRVVLNLRGESTKPHYIIEKKFCAELGFELVNIPMSARAAPKKETLFALIEIFRKIERPFFIHCKSGADRTGLAAAIFLLVIDELPLEQARKMLSPKFLHFKFSSTGVLDAVLDEYEKIGGDFEDWLKDHYDPKAVQLKFDCSHKSTSFFRIWPRWSF